MPFVTSFERRGMRKLIEAMLRNKFGDEAAELMPAILELDDAEKYEALSQTIMTAGTLDEVRRACAKAAAPAPKRKKNGPRKRGSAES